MKNRIRELRQELDLTMDKFAAPLGVGKTAISKIESGERNVTDQMVKSICREFNVNEIWLRTGEGEMFASDSSFDLSEYAKRRGVTDLELQILKAYFDLDSDFREKLLQHFKERLTVEQKKPIPVSEDGQDNWKKEAFTIYQGLEPGQKEQVLGLMRDETE